MAAEVAKKIIMACCDESILVDKFSYGYVLEAFAFPEARTAACGGEAPAPLFILGHMTDGT